MVKTVLVFLSFILLVSLFLNSNITGFAVGYDQQLIQDVDVADEEYVSKTDFGAVQEALITDKANIIVSRRNKELYFAGVPTRKDVDKISLQVENTDVILTSENNFRKHLTLASIQCAPKDNKITGNFIKNLLTGNVLTIDSSGRFNELLRKCNSELSVFDKKISSNFGLEKANLCKEKMKKSLGCQEELHGINGILPIDQEKMPILGGDALGETNALDCYCKERLNYIDTSLKEALDIDERTKLWNEREGVVNECLGFWHSGSFDECKAPTLGRGELGAQQALKDECSQRLKRIDGFLKEEKEINKKAELWEQRRQVASACLERLQSGAYDICDPEISLLGHGELGAAEALKNECDERLKDVDEKLSKETDVEKRGNLFLAREKIVNACFEEWLSGAYDVEQAPQLGHNEYGEDDAITNYCKEQLEHLDMLVSHEYDPANKARLTEKRDQLIKYCQERQDSLGERSQEINNLLKEYTSNNCPSKDFIAVNDPLGEIKISSGENYVVISSTPSEKKKALTQFSVVKNLVCPAKKESRNICPKKEPAPDLEKPDQYLTPQPQTKLVPFSCGDYAYAYINNQPVRSGEVPQGYKVKCQCDKGYKLEGNKCVLASPEQDCVLAGGSFDSSNGKCLLCPEGTTFKNGKCSCESGYVLSGNQCVPACDPPRFFDQSGQCTSCQEFCQNKGMTTQQTDHSAYIKNYLNQNGVCKTNADIRGGGALSVTGTNCQCFDPNPPQISISGDAICPQTPCGPVACNTGKSCSCGQNCVMTVTCNWGGWNYIPGRGAVPILQPGSSQQQAPQQDVQVPADYQGGYGGSQI